VGHFKRAGGQGRWARRSVGWEVGGPIDPRVMQWTAERLRCGLQSDPREGQSGQSGARKYAERDRQHFWRGPGAGACMVFFPLTPRHSGLFEILVQLIQVFKNVIQNCT
jgi:hypothetical protein